MVQRALHIAESLRTQLTTDQKETVVLACQEAGWESLWDAPYSDTLQAYNACPHALLMIDVKTYAASARAGELSPSPRIILYATERENPDIAEEPALLQGICFLLGNPSTPLLKGLMGSILEYHGHNTLVGLHDHLKTSCAEKAAVSQVVNHSGQRALVQDFVTAFFTQKMQEFREQMVAGTSSFPKNLGDVVDEFLMNAIWDANPRRSETDRTQSTPMEEGEEVLVECLCDGVTMTLSVSDPHGTFPDKALLKPLRYALGVKDEARLNEGPGGAGLGLFMILQKVAALAYEVDRGRITRAIALLRGDQSLRDLQKRPRTVLYFHKDSPPPGEVVA